MTDTACKTRSVLIAVDIDEVSRDPAVAEHFTAAEREELAGRHIRSTAGRLALKRAIMGLLNEQGLAEKDIVLTGGRHRPPVLAACGKPETGLPRCLFLSISHTRETAYGLAVRQED